MDETAGFRDDDAGVRRWWDGEKFTDWVSDVEVTPALGHPQTSERTGLAKFLTTPRFMGVVLDGDTVRHGAEGGPVKGAVARIEAGADLRTRLTATRMVALGIFALAAPKRSGHVYLTIEHDDYFIQLQVPVSREPEARRFAATINRRSRQ